MILGIDIGNTTSEFGFIYNGKRINSYKLRSDHTKTVDDWLIDISAIFSIEGMKKESVKDCVISSVVPPLEDRIYSACKKFLGKKPLRIGKELKVPIKINYKNPEEVGIDRVVNAFAGVKRYGKPLILVDLGTAITFDVVNQKGEYEGGAIFPGIDSSIEALFSKTAKLPKVSIENVKKVVGKTTVESIQSGIFFGYISLIEGMIKRIIREKGFSPKVILTGGSGEIITKGLEIDHIFDMYLSLEGIYDIYSYHGN
ncbi:MAG TPA: type III pantothenate kinase [Persephonella sp.]|uniref:Type III pantothenate kinase n=1 Tax=Persephonella marina (strain DSM 14350 / EX-H1) TaxID=123214 RepID=COAX_PERMH|nr:MULTISPECIES: type III pantothenate kinase [Persephonella]C0QU76.1 RecName: Full=Type III pantothenate kinase; AltName: Full=PanK-III; AltName: Full=Pantothenic acid kinase [Persephonella marina EX-H1]ACO04184.1 type III pantothenate kinase (Pantothenic acid kinase)(PanK-III) [Persephonella marina EX-H1]HCB70143.1 type III pantothenate kinase [Persephonella sp.]